MKKIIFIFLFFCLAITTVLAQVATINIATPNSNGLSNNQVNSFDVNSDGTILNNSATGGTAQLGNTGLAANNNITGSEADLILFQVTGTSGSGLNGAIEVFGGEAGLIIANPNGIDCDGCGFINTSKVDLVTGTANFSGDDLTGFSIDGSSTLTVSGSGFLSDAVADELNLVSRNLNTGAQAKANTTLRLLAGNETYDHTTNIITSNATETSGPHSIWISGDLEANYIELISTEISSGGIYGIVNFGRDISADRLKIDSNGLFRNADGGNINISGLLEVINAENFINNSNITAEILSITTDEFFNNDNGSTQLGNIVVTDTFSLSTPNASYTNTGTSSSDSLNLTIGGDFTHESTTLNNFTFNNLGITTEGYYTNNANLTVNNFNVTAGTYFSNQYATINTDSFNVTAGTYFYNYNATISADNFNVVVEGSFYNDFFGTINANGFNVTAGDFNNFSVSTINANDFNVTTNNFSNSAKTSISATINANNFNVTATDDFYNIGAVWDGSNATINANNFNVTAGGGFYNQSNATINANGFNVTAGGNFYYSGDLDFELAANDSLTVLGDAFVAVTNFNNYGTVATDSLKITAENFDANIYNTGTISADSLNFILADTFTHKVNSFNGFSFNNLGVNTRGDFTNRHELNVSTLTITVADFDANINNDSTISADSLNLITSGNFINNSDILENFTFNNLAITANNYTQGVAIDIAGDLSIQVTSEASLDDNASIKARNLFFSAYNLYNQADITITENATFEVWSDFGNGFYFDGTAYDGGDIIANTLNVTARYFSNQFSATISADNFNVTAGYSFSNQVHSTINADNFNVTAAVGFYNGYNFYTDDSAINANDFNVTTDSFYNYDSAISADNFNVIVGNLFYNRDTATINADTVTIDVTNFADDITNTGTVSSDSLNIILTDDFIHNSTSFTGFNNFSNLAITTAGNYTQGAAIDIAGDLRIQASGEASLDDNASIKARNLFFSAYKIYNQADITITENATFDLENDFLNGFDLDGTAYAGGDIIAGNFNVTAGNSFINRNNATISADSFNVTTGTYFINEYTSMINADNFNVITGTYFSNRNVGTINADSFTVTTEKDFANQSSSTINANDFNVTVGDDFRNSTTINADTVTIDVTNFDDDITNTGTVSSDSLNFILTDDFTHSSSSLSGFTNFNNLSFSTDGDFTNKYGFNLNNFTVKTGGNFEVRGEYDTTIDVNNFNVTARYHFLHYGWFSAIVADNFNVTARYFINDSLAIINANDFNVTVERYFINDRSATINANDFNVTTGSYFENSNSMISANNFNVTTGTDFTNDGYGSIINVNNFNVTAGRDFFNYDRARINANNFNVTVGDGFYNQEGFFYNADSDRVATISADSFNVTAGGSFFNDYSTINANSFNVTATGDFTNQTGGLFRGVSQISADNFTVTAGGSFFNDYSTIDANDLNVTIGGDFTNQSATIDVDSFNVTIGGDFTNQSATIDAGIVLITTASNFNNSSSVNADILDILLNDATGSFTNTGGLNANIFNLSVAGDFDYTDRGTVTVNSFNLSVGGDFNFDDLGGDFVLNENYNLTVFGNSDIVAADFKNNGIFNVGDLNITAAGDFDNYATIDAENFNLTVVETFNNRSSATINADSFNATVDDFFNRSSATITANECNIIHTTFYSDLGTITCNDEDEIEVIDIARPDVNGLSNNSYAEFNILNSGIVLNNSDSAGTSQLAGDISANTNYNSGDAASLILAQVTGNDISLLEGALEVFGAEAGVIIANPSGITCNACSFINASRVDLVTGSNYNVATDTFDSIANTNIAIIDDGLDASSVGILNIQAGSFTNTGGLEANSFNLSVAGDFDYTNRGTITTNTINLNVGGNFSNNDASSDFVWNANDSLTVLGTASVVAASFTNSGYIDIANSFNVTAGYRFYNERGAIINANDFNVTAVDRFYNWYGNATINADNFNVSAGKRFYSWTSTINANSFNLTVEEFYNEKNATLNATNNFNVTADNFTNTDGNINADIFSLSVAGDFDYVAEYLGNGTITTNTLNLNVGGDFSNNDAANDFTWNASDSLTVLGTASITADNFTNFGYIDIANSFNVTAGYRFYNERGAIINANDFNVTAVDRFYNWYGNATINADNFNVSAGKRFYSWTSTINANSFNLTVEEFYNEKNATLNATNNFNVTADNFTNTDGNINADIFSLSVAGDFDYVAEYLGNGTITTNTLNLNVVGDFSNNDAANDFTWGANDTLTVLGTASVVADSFSNSGTIAVSNSSFDITAASLNNSGTISANTTLNTTLTSTTSNSFTNTGGVLNATAFALSVAGDFDYVAEYLGNGTITTNTINLNVGGNFSNNDANNDFTWGANDTLTVLGSASVVADSFNNSGNINVANSSFDITAASLNNSGTISANSFNATVDSFINEASATITAAECNIVYTTYTDSGTITCLDSVAGDTTIIDIARPDANGLSNNSYETFHIPSNGIVLNNSDSAGTSQLAGSISANTNYNSGDAASLILAQVTGNDISLLFGALEVFGAEAGVIIANPSGITCNACSFINASRVDLVTGSNYNVATDTFDSIANTNIALIDDGFDASSVGILNIQAGSFTNTGGLEANTFNLNVVGNFDYTNRGTITTNALNLNVGGDFSNNDANNDFVWGANDTLTVLGTASVVAASFNNSGTIAVSNSSFDITATDFTNAGTISANTTLNTTLASTANNSFNNTGGVISADTVSLSVAGDFDDTKKGIINANYFNLTAGGSFINDDTNNDFVLAENDSLSISGDFTIATNNYIQSGMVDVDGALDISTMGDFTNNTGGDISADTLAITVGGIIDNDGTITTTSLTIDTDTIHNSGDITATTSLNINATNDVFSGGSITTNALDIEAGRNFANGGTISTDSFEITAGYTVINKGSIASDSLDVTTDDFFRNLTGGDISVASLNITAGGKVTNTATIDVSGILSITANNDSARDDDPAGAFFYVSNRGNITATDLNIAAVDNFYNRGNITTTSSFTTSAKNVFLLNEEIDSFVGTYDGGNISLSGDSSFTADSRIENYGNIDLGSNILDISADSFTNHAGATIDAATLNLDVNSLIQNGFINAVINHQ